jgi:hypothetical protein
MNRIEDMMRKEGEFDEKIDVERMKLEQQEDQAAARIRVANEKDKCCKRKKQTSYPSKSNPED